MKLYAPNGKGEINAHPAKVDEMISKGWLKEDPNMPVEEFKAAAKKAAVKRKKSKEVK